MTLLSAAIVAEIIEVADAYSNRERARLTSIAKAQMNPPHCSSCGAAFLAVERAQPHPHCHACNTTDWQNPRPVLLLLQPVLVSGGLGLAVAKRGIEPAKHGYALPGGFQEIGETSLEGACREFREETGVDLAVVKSRSCITLGDLPSTSGTQSLVFVQNNTALAQQDFDKLQDTSEMYDWTVLHRDSDFELCWPTHQLIARQWLEAQAGTGFSSPGYVQLPAFRR
ncbi:8-oxo-dGTP diphosphatase [Brevundimonas phage vB_BpoS-Kabachok]|uniref:8-oxo-dGTP diphosphatase n=1 Tax=Brevundimonas phage vB_BpoS-Kabachok TaxID=2948600 RepID=A0A9E7SLS5_9CAUD|nr:8-oxo-dGTP diphosphatase [Brevundimonas phage vB_BpoS-Kabachok]